MEKELSINEKMKAESRGLRGDIAKGLDNKLTGELSSSDQQLLKFHGSYQQDDRDRREERENKKLEWAYSYMVRLRIPGGDIDATQWLELQNTCDKYASGTIKITTRQTIQYHGIVKSRLKPTMQDFDRLGLDTIAACGDVNRNVMCGANPALSAAHDEIFQYADKISAHLLPKTNAFTEIWLDGEKLNDEKGAEEDPLYLDTYLPRKFKIAIAIPPLNDTDVFANDIGLIAIIKDNKFEGFNISVGGGLGMTHGNANTYPRRGTVIGFIPKEKVLDIVWQIVAIQRDHGDRSDRKLARLKYTIDRLGIEWFRTELNARSESKLEHERPFLFNRRGDLYGWFQDKKKRWYYGAFVESGLVKDDEGYLLKSALKEIAMLKACGFRFTGNQNIMLTNIGDQEKYMINQILEKYGIVDKKFSLTRKDAIACVALPTCPLALAEGQRYLPTLINKIEKIQDSAGIGDTPISIRMTGCPNGCGRPYLAEIGLIGKAQGKYVLRLGGDSYGERLNQAYLEEADESEILECLRSLFSEYATHRHEQESFGDYFNRTAQ